MSTFEITLSKSPEMDQLENAINAGKIIACSDYSSNVFSVSQNNLLNLLKDWKNSYPELKPIISRWKYGNFTDEEVYSNKRFKVSTINGGKETLFSFIAIRPKSNENRLECIECCVKYKFEAYYSGIFDRIFNRGDNEHL